jgi:hypothetical protein
MAGWHMRLWRRVKVAPGLTINFSKSGPSLSVGPRGSKMTFGKRGVRQTVGLPGTGLYMFRQLSSTPVWGRPAEPGPTTAAPQPSPIPPIPAADTQPAPFEVHYGMPLVVAVVIGVVLGAYHQSTSVVLVGAILAFVTGLRYEALAAHHPVAAKVIAQVVVAVAAVASILVGIVLVLAAAGVGASDDDSSEALSTPANALDVEPRPGAKVAAATLSRCP